MKQLKFAVLMIGLMITSSLCSIHAKAQEKTDIEVVAVNPVFTGEEKNLTDSLLSVGKALTDPALKATVIDAVNVIRATPQHGGIDDWYAWIIAAAGAIFGVYQYVKRALSKKEPEPTPRGFPL
jgi:hypothetical protein